MTLDEVKRSCETCEKCALAKSKTNTVFGTGNERATLMFVGEAPGGDEDRSGIPFVGRAGKLLDLYLEAVGIARDEVYIANILKCRPPQNRDPDASEAENCFPYLKEQIRCIKPKIIVCLGRIAAMKLIREDFRITKEHGVFVKKGSFDMTAVYHPSLLLRDPTKREDMLTDMLLVAQKLREHQNK